jgi:cystathionine beta-lyase
MTQNIDAGTLRRWLMDGAEIALFDVREHGQFGEGHIFHAVSLPYSRLELDVVRLAPRRSVRTVLVDDDGCVAARAAARLRDCGYGDVHVLAGGNAAWEAAGNALFAGLNVVSKAFGELVEHGYGTPNISALELAEMMEQGRDVVVLDGRPFAEYQKMTIPRAICCPNGELGLRVRDLVRDEKTPIVVNCAGRTRSIIGAQTLINLGLKNPVYALRNGTMGWTLDRMQLENGSGRRHSLTTDALRVAEARERAQALAARTGVGRVDAGMLQRWLGEAERTTFVCDVRTAEEFELGSVEGAQHAPGGQLVQATDQYVGVRNARIVLVDSDGVRAPIIGSWLRQMGQDAVILDGADLSHPTACTPAALTDALPGITAAELAAELQQGGVAVIDIGHSMRFRAAHVPGSTWSIRPRLTEDAVDEGRRIVLIGEDEPAAHLAGRELTDAQRSRARVLAGGFAAWRAAELPVAASPDEPPDRKCIDFLFFVHDRHEGNMEAALRYLSWETGLVEQMADHERATFTLMLPQQRELTHA